VFDEGAGRGNQDVVTCFAFFYSSKIEPGFSFKTCGRCCGTADEESHSDGVKSRVARDAGGFCALGIQHLLSTASLDLDRLIISFYY
jgi:hypothetical protein